MEEAPLPIINLAREIISVEMIISVGEYEKAIELACAALKKGKLVVFPTDTLYGLGADARSDTAVGLVRTAKGRDERPISIVCSDLGMMREYCEIDEKLEETLSEILPGPYTIILKSKKGKLANGLSPDGTIGVRVPRYFLLLDLVRACGFPVTSTSANLSGGKNPCSLADIPNKLKGKAEVLIDGGKCHFSAPSTIVDMTVAKPRIVRQGAGDFPPKREFDPSVL